MRMRVWGGSRRDWLVAFLLAMATIQCVRADFLTNETFLDWHRYAAGQEVMPFQGRVGMMPVLRAAENSAWFGRVAARFGKTITTASLHQEPVTVEKVASMAVSLISLAGMMGVAFWWSRRRGMRPWWLANVLLLMIVAVTTSLRATQNFWYAYDLPHAALFGCAIVLALEECWWAATLLFLLDMPMRETSILLIPVFAGFVYLQMRGRRGRRWILALAVGETILIAWVLVRIRIDRAFLANGTVAFSHHRENLHQLLLPHHWPQLLSAGGYLPLLVWLERRRLGIRETWMLYAALLMLPGTLLYGVWTETRVWLEWTMPLAVLATVEVSSWLREGAVYQNDSMLDEDDDMLGAEASGRKVA